MPKRNSASSATSPRRNLNPDEIEEARKLFHSIDLDSSGTIDLRELGLMFEKMNYDMTETEVMEVMTKIDMDEDGVINFTEFLRAVAMRKVQSAFDVDERDVVSVFAQCGGNEDKSGNIDRKKVEELLDDFGVSIDSTMYDVFGENMDFERFASIFSPNNGRTASVV